MARSALAKVHTLVRFSTRDPRAKLNLIRSMKQYDRLLFISVTPVALQFHKILNGTLDNYKVITVYGHR